MERGLMHNLIAPLAIPTQTIETVLGARLLKNNTDRRREPDGIMRRVWGKEEHLPLADRDVAKLWAAGVDHLEEHAALVLVEPFRGAINMVVCTGVGTADNLLRNCNVNGYTRCNYAML